MSDQTKYTQKLKGKRALVIGGSSGIGFAVAEALVEYGVEVTIASSRQTRIDSSLAALKKSYPSAADRIFGYVCDLGDEKKIEANIAELLERLSGPVDHVVYTAADPLAIVEVQDITLELIQRASLLRVSAPMLVAKHATKYLRPGPESSITFTTGTIAEKPIGGWAVVGAYGAAITGMTRGLALDLKPIRVNCIAPGAVDTPLWSDDQRKGLFRHLESTLPTGRVPLPSEVAEAYLYVIRDNNVTGSMVSTNGGALLV